MRALKVKNGVVENVAVFDKLPNANSGWMEAPDGVGIDWIDNGDGTFSPPVKPEPEPPTIIEQTHALDRSITPRDLRLAILGDLDAIAKIQSVEDQVTILLSE